MQQAQPSAPAPATLPPINTPAAQPTSQPNDPGQFKIPGQ
jgi:hypothetical protein